MPTVLASTRIATEQQEVEEIGRRLEELDDELKKALVADDEPAVARLDTEIAQLKRRREHHHIAY